VIESYKILIDIDKLTEKDKSAFVLHAEKLKLLISRIAPTPVFIALKRAPVKTIPLKEYVYEDEEEEEEVSKVTKKMAKKEVEREVETEVKKGDKHEEDLTEDLYDEMPPLHPVSPPPVDSPILMQKKETQPDSPTTPVIEKKTEPVVEQKKTEPVVEQKKEIVKTCSDYDHCAIDCTMDCLERFYNQKINNDMFVGCRFIQLKFMNVRNINFKGFSFDGANLMGSQFYNCNFSNCSFIGANIMKTQFINCQMIGDKVMFVDTKADSDTVFDGTGVEFMNEWVVPTSVEDFVQVLLKRGLEMAKRVQIYL
jgi:hypothetical protein